MNPWKHGFTKAGVPNMDPVFGSGLPYSLFDSTPFAQMISKPGQGHPWVYAAISAIVDSYVQCPLRLFDKRDPKKELIDDHPILDLLAHPNPNLSGTNFLEAVVWALNLPTRRGRGGQCFIWGGNKENFRKGVLPDELWLQSDETIQPQLNAQKILMGWKLQYQAGISPYDYGTLYLDTQEVLRINFYNPYNNFEGLAPGYALKIAIGQDAIADQHNTAILTNGGLARGIISMKKPLSPQQADEFRANLSKYSEGAANSGKNMVLPWDVDYNQLSMNAEDMAYMESKGWNRDSILAVHKTSKFMVGLYEDLNYATAKEAKRQLFDQGILPLHRRIMQELNQSWLDFFDRGNLNLTCDFSNVSALHDDTDARYKRAGLLVDMGVPPVIALKMNEIPVDDLGKFAWLMQNQSPHAAFSAPSPSDDSDGSTGKRVRSKNKAVLSEEDKANISDEFVEKIVTPGEQSLVLSIRSFFLKQRNRNMDLVDAWAKTKSVSKAEISDLMLDQNKEDALLRSVMLPHYEQQARHAKGYALMMMERTKDASTLTEDSTDADIRDFINKRLLEISVLNQTTFDGVEEALSQVISDSLAAGETRAQTAKRIREALPDVYQNRIANSKTIARTETAAVANSVSYIAAENAEMTTKQWLSARDEKVRIDHAMAADQGPIPMGEKFVNGMDHPNESGAPASEVCNCRCSLVFSKASE